MLPSLASFSKLGDPGRPKTDFPQRKLLVSKLIDIMPIIFYLQVFGLNNLRKLLRHPSLSLTLTKGRSETAKIHVLLELANARCLYEKYET